MRERDLIDRYLKPLATHPAARGLIDDAAVISPALGRDLVLTHDVIACGVHYLPTCPPSDVAWKLVAVNLSDLAAKGAKPTGVLMGLGLSAVEDEAWIAAFTDGLARVLAAYDCPLLGGDTVTGLGQAVLGLTAIGAVEPGQGLSRVGARPGDNLYVTGTIGDAGLGLAIARGAAAPDKYLLNRYRRPTPRLAVGQRLAGLASAAMDVSDGLLIDADRLARASGLAVTIDLALVPVSEAALLRVRADDVGRLALASAGDDYELLFAAPPSAEAALLTICEEARVRLTCVGHVAAGAGLTVIGQAGAPIEPGRLGYEHES